MLHAERLLQKKKVFVKQVALELLLLNLLVRHYVLLREVLFIHLVVSGVLQDLVINLLCFHMEQGLELLLLLLQFRKLFLLRLDAYLPVLL